MAKSVTIVHAAAVVDRIGGGEMERRGGCDNTHAKENVSNSSPRSAARYFFLLQ